MSEITPKNYNGLMEAYASIYNKPEQTTQEQLEEEICFEDLEVDNDLMVDLVVERLIVEGYANTEDQALNMIPHMSDAWLDTVVGNFVLEESFIDAVNSLVDEGYDLSSYTVDELFEDYVGHFNNYLTEDHHMDLHEAIPLLAAPLLANPATWAAGAALGAGALYAGKKAFDAWNQRRSGGWNQSAMDNIQWRDSKPAVKPSTTLKSKTRDVNLDRPGGSATYPGTGYGRGDVNLGSTSSQQQRSQAAKERLTGQSGGGGGGKPPKGDGGKPPETPPSGGGGKPPKIDPLQTVKDVWKAGKDFVGKGKGPISQVLGQPARARFFGSTRLGQGTRAATTSALSGLDIATTLADPAKQTQSRVAQLGSIGPGFVGTVSQGLGYVAGGGNPKAGGLEKGLYKFGQSARQVGREMRDQPWTKPAQPAQPSTPPPSRVKWK